jgi:dTDP-4-dehydrorhamnose reductase
MKILVFGHNGQVATALRKGDWQDASVISLGRDAANIIDPLSVKQAIADIRPDVVVNAAAYTAVDRAESEAELAYAVNRDGAGHIAAASQAAGAPLIHLSTDYVFDGGQTTPYPVDAPRAPLGVYGASKAAGEDAVQAAGPRHIIIRTSWVFSGGGQNFVHTMLRLGAERDQLRVVADQFGCPTAADDLAAAIVAAARRALANDTGWGVQHYCGAPTVSWHGFATAIFAERQRQTGAPPPTIAAIATADYPTPARRPAHSVLDCRRFAADFAVAPADWRAALVPVVRQCLDGL